MAKTKKTRASKYKSSHKKSSGLKGYGHYLLLVAVVVVGLIVNNRLSTSSQQVLGNTTDLSASTLLPDTNNERVQEHETALSINSALMNAAQAKANDMAARDYWSHNTPDGATPWSFIIKAGYAYASAGENLAYGFTSAQAVMSGWMHSPEHRANILNSKYQDVGFGIASSPNYQGHGPETIVVAMYGQPASAAVASVTSQQLNAANNQSTSTPAQQTVARFQQLTGINSAMLDFGVVVATIILLAYLVIKHSLRWRRVLVNSEAFVQHHPWLDTAVMALVMTGYIISHAAGYIG